LVAKTINGAFRIGEIEIVPFAQGHGRVDTLGLRIGRFAYSTDVNQLTEAAFAALADLDVWIVDCARYQPNPGHAHLPLTLNWIERLAPRRAILTHMSSEFDYQTLANALPAGVEPAYDGMVIEVAD
jgi:phosphoribosyl 1,2-cyclic phosphate phosphodiesterase